MLIEIILLQKGISQRSGYGRGRNSGLSRPRSHQKWGESGKMVRYVVTRCHRLHAVGFPICLEFNFEKL